MPTHSGPSELQLREIKLFFRVYSKLLLALLKVRVGFKLSYAVIRDHGAPLMLMYVHMVTGKKIRKVTLRMSEEMYGEAQKIADRNDMTVPNIFRVACRKFLGWPAPTLETKEASE